MIVKVADPRRDGKTSFFRLTEYAVGGIAAGIDPHMISFDALTQYITTETTLDAMGDNVEKTIAVEIGNLSSLHNAAKEMWAVSLQNTKCEDPVFHYILSWSESERPPIDQIMAAARKTLAVLGLQDHQYVVAIHANTDNLHAHVEVNRVHPVTFKARHLEWTYKTLHRAAREIEIEFGWKHDNGLWEVIEVGEKKIIVPGKSYLDPDLALSQKAKDFELWNGSESFEGWLKRNPARELRKVIDRSPSDWQVIHQMLSKYGIELKDSGGYGLRVELLKQSEEDKPVAIAASKAFRFLKRKELEKSLGPFVPLDPDAPAPVTVRSYKRDSIRRLTRRMERMAEREALWQQYLEHRAMVGADRDMVRTGLKQSSKAINAERYRLIKASYMAKREQIKKDKAMSGKQKQQAYTLLKMTYLEAREELKIQIETERKEINELMPKLVGWRTWVEEQAQQGNEAAISALRGIVYEEKRKVNREGEADEEEELIPSIRPAPARPGDDPTIRPLNTLAWRVSTNGRIFYRFKTTNEHAFIDEGQRLTFGRPDVTDEALMVTLRYAKTKWGDTLHITGGDGIFRERLLRIATSLHMTVDNKELQDLQQQLLSSKARTAPAEMPVREDRKLEMPGVFIIEDFVRDNPGARIIPPYTEYKSYKGKIEHVSEAHALQAIGKNKYVLHELALLDSSPAVGADIEIRYRSGAGKVTQNTRARGR